MKTIAHVNSEAGYSGGEAQMFLLMDGLRERGWPSVTICPPGSASAAEARERGYPTAEVAMRNDLDLFGAVGIARAARRLGADLLQLHTGRATWLGGIASRLVGVPAVTTRRMDRRVRPGLRTRLIYNSLVAHTIAISTAVRDCLLEPGLDERGISVVWDAVDPDEWTREPAADLRRERGVANGTTLVVALAALVHRKGLDVLVEAMRIACEQGHDLCAWIGGEGPEREALERAIATAGLTDRIELLGWRTDKLELLAAADVAALPSRREGVGVAALEAMAANKPVVASAVGGLGEVVEHEVTGLTVPPDDAVALAEALGRLAGDAELRATLGAAGARRVRERYSADTLVDGYLAVYERVLAEAPGVRTA